jgi:cytochrome c-type biogenesis protein CcmE
MTRRRRRLVLLLVCGLGLGTAVALMLVAFSDNLVFFLAPSDLTTKAPRAGRTFRLGGLVEEGSVTRTHEGTRPVARFRVTDGTAAVTVNYAGLLPDLFREGQGVVALGTMEPDGTFRASEVLAKHDATYMPKEVVDALKKAGHWDPKQGAPPPAAGWSTAAPRSATGG